MKYFCPHSLVWSSLQMSALVSTDPKDKRTKRSTRREQELVPEHCPDAFAAPISLLPPCPTEWVIWGLNSLLCSHLQPRLGPSSKYMQSFMVFCIRPGSSGILQERSQPYWYLDPSSSYDPSLSPKAHGQPYCLWFEGKSLNVPRTCWR